MIGTRKPKKLRKIITAIFAMMFTLAGVNIAGAENADIRTKMEEAGDYTVNAVEYNPEGAGYYWNGSELSNTQAAVNLLMSGINQTGRYIQDQGSLTIGDASTITLAADSAITGGTLSIGSGASLVLNNVESLGVAASNLGTLTLYGGSKTGDEITWGSLANDISGGGTLYIGSEENAAYINNTGLINNNVLIQEGSTLKTVAKQIQSSGDIENRGVLVLTGSNLDSTGVIKANIVDTQGEKTGTLVIGDEVGNRVIHTDNHNVIQAEVIIASNGSSGSSFHVQKGGVVEANNIIVESKSGFNLFGGNATGDVTLKESGTFTLWNEGGLDGNIISAKGGNINIQATSSNVSLKDQITGKIKGSKESDDDYGNYKISATGSSGNIAIINRAIRGATEVNVSGNVVITDEAYTSTNANISNFTLDAMLTLENTTNEIKNVNNKISKNKGSIDINIVNSNETPGTTILNGEIKNADDINIKSGTAQFGAKVTANKVNVDNGATLNANTDSMTLANGITTDGTINLTGSSNTNNVDGLGSATINSNMANTGEFTNATLTISEDKEFTSDADKLKLTTGIINKGDLYLTGGTSDTHAASGSAISGTGATWVGYDTNHAYIDNTGEISQDLAVKNATFKTNANLLTGDEDIYGLAKSTIELTGGTLSRNLKGSGGAYSNLIISDDTTNAEGNGFTVKSLEVTSGHDLTNNGTANILGNKYTDSKTTPAESNIAGNIIKGAGAQGSIVIGEVESENPDYVANVTVSGNIAGQNITVKNGSELHMAEGSSLTDSSVAVESSAIFNSIDGVINDYMTSSVVKLANNAIVKGDVNYASGTADTYKAGATTEYITYKMARALDSSDIIAGDSKKIQVTDNGVTVNKDSDFSWYNTSKGLRLESSGSNDGKIILIGKNGGFNNVVKDTKADVHTVSLYDLDGNDTFNVVDHGIWNADITVAGEGIEETKPTLTLNEVLAIDDKSTLTIQNSKVAGGSKIQNDGELTIQNSVVNTAIESTGTLNLEGLNKGENTTIRIDSTDETSGILNVRQDLELSATYDEHGWVSGDYISGNSQVVIGREEQEGNLSLALNTLTEKPVKFSIVNGKLEVKENGLVVLNNEHDTWGEDGILSNTGGTIVIGDMTKKGRFEQTSGETIFASNIPIELENGTNPDSITGGSIYVGNGESPELGYKTLISNIDLIDGVGVSIERNGILQIKNGVTTLGADDTWNGVLKVTDNGEVVLNDGITRGENAKYIQEGGIYRVIKDETFDDSYEITGGTIKIGDETHTATLTTETTALGSGVTKEITQKGTWNIKGGNSDNPNTLDVAQDTWDGKVSLGDGGYLELKDYSGENAIETSGTKTYNQTGGELKLNNSSLTLKSGSTIKGGAIDIDSSNLVFDNGADNHTTVVIEDDSILNVIGKYGASSPKSTTLTLDEGSNITSGTVNVGDGTSENILALSSDANIGAGASVNIADNATFNVGGGQAVLNANDTWNGEVAVGGGTFNYQGATKDEGATLSADTGAVTITSGTLDLNNENDYIVPAVVLTINEGTGLSASKGVASISSNDVWAGTATVSGGRLILSGVDDTAETPVRAATGKLTATSGDLILQSNTNLVLKDDDSIAQAVKTTINNGSTLKVVNNNATVALGTDDTWLGTVENAGNSNLTLDGITGEHAKSGVFKKSAGTTTITNGFDINNEDDSVTGGTLDVQTGDLNVSAGTIAAEANIQIAGGDLNISGGTVNYGGANDYLSGEGKKINETDGTLNIVDSTSTTLDVSGGILNIKNENTVLTVGAGSSIIAGAANAQVIIDAGTTMDITGGSVTLDGGNSFTTIDDSDVQWNGAVLLNGGSLTLKNIIDKERVDGERWNKTGTLTANEGNLSIDQTTVLLGNGDYIDKDVNLTLTLNDKALYVQDDAEVSVDKNDTWESGRIELHTGGELTLDDVTTIAADPEATPDPIIGTYVVADGGVLNLVSTKGGTGISFNNDNDNIGYGTTVKLNTDLGVNAGSVSLDSSDTLTKGTITLDQNGKLDLKAVSTVAADPEHDPPIAGVSLQAKAGTLNIQTGETKLLNAADVIESAVKTTIDADGKLTIGKDGVTVTLNDVNADPADDVWNGAVNLEKGSFNLVDSTVETSSDNSVRYTQTGGTLNINNSSLTLGENDSYVKDDAYIALNNDGKFVIENTYDNAAIIIDDGSDNVLTIGDGAKASKLTLKGGSDISYQAAVTIAANTMVTNSDGSTLRLSKTIDTEDTWNGTLDNQGNLVLTNMKKDAGAFLYQTTANKGDILVFGTDGDNIFDLNNSADEISAGTLTIGDGADAVGMNVSAGKITDTAYVDLKGNATLGISGTGDVTFNGAGTSASPKTPDDWSGNVVVSGGTFTMQDALEHKTQDGSFNQTGGQAVLKGNSSLTIDSDDSLLDGGEFDVQDTSKLIISNGLKDHKSTLKTDDTANTVTIDNGSDLELLAGSTVAKGTAFTLDEGSILKMSNGTEEKQTEVNINAGDSWLGEIDLSNEYSTLNYDGLDDNGLLKADKGNLNIGQTDAAILTIEDGSSIAKAVDTSLAKDSTLAISDGGSVEFNGAGTSASPKTPDGWEGSITMDGGNFSMSDGLTHTTDKDASYQQTGGSLTIDNSTLVVDKVDEGEKESYVKGGGVTLQNKGKLIFKNGLTDNKAKVVSDDSENELRVGDGTTRTKVSLDNDTYVLPKTVIDIAATSELEINGPGNASTGAEPAKVAFNENDNWSPDGTIRLTDGFLVHQNRNDVVDNDDVTKPNFYQTGGTLQMVNSKMTMADASKNSNGGDIEIDKNSTLKINDGSLNADNIKTSGMIDSLNKTTDNKHHVEGDLTVINDDSAKDAFGNPYAQDGQADFRFDIYARDRKSQDNDSVTTEGRIQSTDPNTEAVIYIDDWDLLGDIEGKDAPIDKSYDFKFFDAKGGIAKNIRFAETNKLVKTPIGYFGLHGDGKGNYKLKLDKWNHDVFRGQVATVAQYQNQLTVNNILFDHVDLVDENYLTAFGGGGNRYASADTALSPYQYDKEDGSIWVKAYGNFEHIQMSQHLDVENNAYGSLIGIDLPRRNLGKGWKVLPTIYAAYNGAHQNYERIGIWENGGQLGAMGTFTRGNFLGSVLGYGGGYSTRMSGLSRGSDNAGNWFAGTAAKAAYNFRLPLSLTLQPTLLASYNIFGRQNWHTQYGAMSMHSGLLNGINVAPGLNLIWNKDTFSIYTTTQLMFNILGDSAGKAGNVDLPNIRANNVYFEYGLGARKTFKDRFSAYLQTTARAGARRGAVFQGGFEMKVGKVSKTNKKAKTSAAKGDVNLERFSDD